MPVPHDIAAETEPWDTYAESAFDPGAEPVFGCAWFAGPGRLFPRVRARLHPAGRFVFSQPPAIPGAYGPQGMYKGGFAGPAMYTYRYAFRPRVWERLLVRAGFETAEAVVLDARDPGHIGTLIVTARTPPSRRTPRSRAQRPSLSMASTISARASAP